MPRKPRLPRIRGTQLGLANPAQVDQIKADMLAGRFVFSESQTRIDGLRDRRGVYYVKDGHHRMVAAMEIYRESGEPYFVLELVRWGRWNDTRHAPNDACPLPFRSCWGAFWNWLGF